MVVERVERLDERIDQRQAERKTDAVRERAGRKRVERARRCCGSADTASAHRTDEKVIIRETSERPARSRRSRQVRDGLSRTRR